MLLQQQDGLLPLLQPQFQVVDLPLLLQQLLLEAIIALLQRLTERLWRTDVTEVNAEPIYDHAKPGCSCDSATAELAGPF